MSSSDAWGASVDGGDLTVNDDIDNAGAKLYATAIGLNTWVHAVLILSSLDNQLIINGVSKGTGTAASGDWSSFNGDLFIGARTGVPASGFKGGIALFRVYSQVLTIPEALGHFNQERHLFGV
jgi:hypothetical protein